MSDDRTHACNGQAAHRNEAGNLDEAGGKQLVVVPIEILEPSGTGIREINTLYVAAREE